MGDDGDERLAYQAAISGSSPRTSSMKRTASSRRMNTSSSTPSRKSGERASSCLEQTTHSRHHRGITGDAFSDIYGRGDHAAMRHSVTLRPLEDYTNKYKGEQIEVALFGGEYQEGVLTAYCSFEDVPHVELNGHILIPLQNVASLHCSSRCDAPEPDWPPRGFIEDDTGES
jgi:hypothetical protein